MLEHDLRAVFGDRLQSLVAYGLRNAAGPARTMALVTSLTESDLRACAARVESWHESGLSTPLILPVHDLERALDVFPLEFDAIAADHVLVAGASPFARAIVEPSDVRRACEVRARSHLLHLREGFMEARGNAHALAVLIVESAAAMRALTSSVARLEGRSDGDAAGAGRHLERALGIPAGAITEVVALAGVHEISAPDAERLFPPYLRAMERLVEYVDGWSSTSNR